MRGRRTLLPPRSSTAAGLRPAGAVRVRVVMLALAVLAAYAVPLGHAAAEQERPALLWSARFGHPEESALGGVAAVEFAADGDLVVAGSIKPRAHTAARAANLPDPLMPPGSGEQPYGAGDRDAYVARYSPSGTLRWLTYVGGVDGDGVVDMDVAPDGRIALGGQTYSQDFPVIGGGTERPPGLPHPTFLGFTTVLSADGTQRLFSGYEPWTDAVAEVEFGPDGALVVAGTGFNVTPAVQPTPGAAGHGAPTEGSRGIVVQRDAAMVLQWRAVLRSTRRPNDVRDPAQQWPQVSVGALAVDPHSGAVFVGTTTYGDMPTTRGAWQRHAPPGQAADAHGSTTFDRSDLDVHVSRLDGHRGGLDWATYIAGSRADGVTAATVVDGELVLTGSTYAADYPQVGGLGACHDAANETDTDLTITRLRADGSGARFSRCVGGPVEDFQSGAALAADAGRLYVLGGGAERRIGPSPDGLDACPADGAHRDVHSSGWNVVLLAVEPDGGLAWTGCLGGDGTDNPRAVAARGGRLAVGGKTSSPTFPGTTAPPTNQQPSDSFVSVLTVPAAAPPPSPSPSAAPASDGPTAGPGGTTPPTATPAPPAPPEPAAAGTPPAASSTAAPSPTGAPPSPSPSTAPPTPPPAAQTPPPPAPTPSSPDCAAAPRLTVLDPAVSTGARSRVRVTAPPGSAVRLEGYNRSRGRQPTYRTLRGTVTVPAGGMVEWELRPTSNTRVRAVGCTTSNSDVVRVRLTLSPVRAQRLGPRNYRFAGRLNPSAVNEDRPVVVSYRPAGGGDVLRTVAYLHGGVWQVRLRMPRAGRWIVTALSDSDVVNDGGRSPDRPTVVH